MVCFIMLKFSPRTEIAKSLTACFDWQSCLGNPAFVPLTTEIKSGVVFHMSRVPAVDLSCALRVFLLALRFSSLLKINTLSVIYARNV